MVFPNYVVLPENKYMFKNIERKQRMIDERQKYKTDKERKHKERKEKAQGVEDFIEIDTQISNSISLDKTIEIEESKTKPEEKKRKVKRVDYTLKITSNDIERNQPHKEIKYTKPKTYQIGHSKEKSSISNTSSGSKIDFSKVGRKKNSSQQKRLNDKDIFGTNNNKILKTQRYEKSNYHTSKYSPIKGMYQSKSTTNIKTGAKSKPLHTKNFQILSNKKSAFDPIKPSKKSLPGSKDLLSYKTKPKEEKGHFRGETWTGNQYLSIKNTSAHGRKKSSIGKSKPELATLSESQSVKKMRKGILKKDIQQKSTVKNSRQSLGDRNNTHKKYITKSDISKKVSTPTSNGMVIKSGAYTTRTIVSDSVKPVLLKTERKIARKGYGGTNSSSETRRPKIFSKKLRTQSRGENTATKENSSTSSKTSQKCLSNLSKSNSRRNDKNSSSQHLKKKSVVIPTKKTKVLYSNKSEYDRKRNSKATDASIKPSSSAANLDTKKLSSSKSGLLQSQRLKAQNKTRKLKYLTNNEEAKSKYGAAKTSREKGRLIEFKLHEDELPDSKNENLKPKSRIVDSNLGAIQRLYAHKSQKLFSSSYSKSARGYQAGSEKTRQGAKLAKYK